MSSTPQSNPRTIETLRNYGFIATTVEHRIEVQSKAWENKYKKPRRDVFRIFDILACRVDQGVVAIQATDAQSPSKHINKMLESEFLGPWLQVARCQIWQWKKVVKGTERLVYRPIVLEAKLVDGAVNFVPLPYEEWLAIMESYGRPIS
jgi:hypothetical protein